MKREIGMKVEFKGSPAEIVSYEKGWYTLAIAEGETAKARDKDISPLVEAIDSEVDKEWFIKCVECDEEWTVVKTGKPENLKCGKCGAWCIVRLHPDHERYHRGLGTTASGNSSYDVDDVTAQDLRGMDLSTLYSTAGEILAEIGYVHMSKSMKKQFKDAHEFVADEIAGYLEDRYMGRNDGMKRMNVGNIIRGARKRKVAAEEGEE